MQHHDAVVGENAGAFLKERIIEADADMLEHADRDNTVECAGNVTVVERLEGGGALQLAFPGALARDCELLLRKRDAQGPGAADLRGIERKPAPAAADVKKPMSVFEEQLGGEVALLGELGVVEAVPRSFEIGAAVLAIRVKEERIEAAVEVVVVGDVAPRPAAPIALPHAPPPETKQRKGCGPPWPGKLIRHNIDKLRDRPAIDHEGAVHVGFAKLEVGIEQHRALGARGDETYRDRRAAAVAERICCTSGCGHLQIAAGDMRQCQTQKPVHDATLRLGRSDTHYSVLFRPGPYDGLSLNGG